MLRHILTVLLLLVLATPVFATEHLRLATTTSTENSGLLAVLIPPFEKANNCQVDVIAVGTGKAIKLGETGDVDVSWCMRASWRTSSSPKATASIAATSCTTIS